MTAASVVNYTGPDESVECAYPGCTNRLRRSDFNEPQFCSAEHRDAAGAALAASVRCPECGCPVGYIHSTDCSKYPEVHKRPVKP